MKKFLTILLLLLVVAVSYSQDTFVRKYTTMISTRENVAEEEVKANLTVVFNPNKEKGVKFYYGSGKTSEYYQVSDLEKGKTEGGYEYQLVEIIDKEEGNQITLQLFDTIGVLRLIFSKGNTIEFYE